MKIGNCEKCLSRQKGYNKKDRVGFAVFY